MQFIKIKEASERNNFLDLPEITWFYPSTLLLVGHLFREYYPDNRYVCSRMPWINDSLDLIMGVREGPREEPAIIPVVVLPKESSERDSFLKILYQPFKGRWKKVGGKGTYGHIVNELADNVYGLSECDKSVAMVQCYPVEKFTELCFLDDGITFNGSYQKAGLEFGGREAIENAVTGVSAKGEDNGRGIISCINLVVDGYKGDILIVSGNTAFYCGQRGEMVFDLPALGHLDGTMVTVRMPFHKKELDRSKYIGEETRPVNKDRKYGFLKERYGCMDCGWGIYGEF